MHLISIDRHGLSLSMYMIKVERLLDMQNNDLNHLYKQSSIDMHQNNKNLYIIKNVQRICIQLTHYQQFFIVFHYIIYQQESFNNIDQICSLSHSFIKFSLYIILMVGFYTKIWLIAIILLLQYGCSNNLYKFVPLSTQRGALCLDGSPAGLYYHIGSQVNKDKYLIYFNGGGFCKGETVADTLQSCYKRSKTDLGSTKNSPQTINLDNNGILSTLQVNNPVFYDWTKVVMIYCDGSQYTGSRTQPISYKDTKLYFRGHNNTLQQLRYMDQHFDFYNSQKIVITGVSAGGVATYLYSNHLMQHTKKAKVYAIPDSGLFITQFYSPIVGIQTMKLYAQNLFKLVLLQNNAFPIKQCIQQMGIQDIYKCYNAANLAKYLKAPILIVQSLYDQYSLRNIVVIDCLTNTKPPYSIQTCNQTVRGVIQDYRKQTVNAIYKIKGRRSDVGVWAPSCVQHGFSTYSSFTDDHFKVPSRYGKMLYQAIEQFLQNPYDAPWHFDKVGWPFNNGCNGVINKRLTFE